jgi:LmbE family N-acetylglucosaminyl deacetylase
VTNLYPDARPSSPSEPLPIPVRALAVGAHPDDIEFGAGGTLARWAAGGCDVTMLVVTDGSKGSWDPDVNPLDLLQTRRREAEEAARRLGAGRVVFLEHIDGELQYTMELREEICRQIRVHRPDVVLSHDPWRPYELHPDHRATGWAVIDGVVAARDHLFFPGQLTSGLHAHRPAGLLLWRAAAPDHWEDITTTLDRKIDALLAHVSQAATTMGDAHTSEDQRAAFIERIRAWAADQGRAVGLEAAEAFKRITP